MGDPLPINIGDLTMTKTVLILGGSGKIGSHSAEAFWNAGWTVRQYDRATNDMTTAAMGADVIINGLNPANYANWAVNIPAITEQVIAAAKASGTTVIIPGNIYNFGNQRGELNEATLHRPNTRKGRIRVEMEQAYRDAGIQAIILRAGNFIDPDHNGDVMSQLILREAKKRKIAYSGTPETMQAYAYVPDWARAAVALAEECDTLATFEDIPFPGHAFRMTDLKAHLDQVTGQSFRLNVFPWWIMTALSPFLELARELREMRYLYEMDHTLGAAKFNALLPDFVPTPLADVMEAGLPADIHPDKTVRASCKAILAE